MIVALAGIGMAAALYPVLKKQNEGFAIGLLASRVLEAGTIFAGVAFLFSVNAVKTDGQLLAVLYDRFFLVGQSFMPTINALLFGSLLFHPRLVPRALPVLGFIGAFLLLVS